MDSGLPDHSLAFAILRQQCGHKHMTITHRWWLLRKQEDLYTRIYTYVQAKWKLPPVNTVHHC